MYYAYLYTRPDAGLLEPSSKLVRRKIQVQIPIITPAAAPVLSTSRHPTDTQAAHLGRARDLPPRALGQAHGSRRRRAEPTFMRLRGRLPVEILRCSPPTRKNAIQREREVCRAHGMSRLCEDNKRSSSLSLLSSRGFGVDVDNFARVRPTSSILFLMASRLRILSLLYASSITATGRRRRSPDMAFARSLRGLWDRGLWRRRKDWVLFVCSYLGAKSSQYTPIPQRTLGYVQFALVLVVFLLLF